MSIRLYTDVHVHRAITEGLRLRGVVAADHIREFEAEPVCYLVCSRLGLNNPSDAYLADYVHEHDETYRSASIVS